MALVPAKCTNCGANLRIESTHDAGICPYCHTPFVTEKVINNYSVTVNNSSTNIFEHANISMDSERDHREKLICHHLKICEYKTAWVETGEYIEKYPYLKFGYEKRIECMLKRLEKGELSLVPARNWKAFSVNEDGKENLGEPEVYKSKLEKLVAQYATVATPEECDKLKNIIASAYAFLDSKIEEFKAKAAENEAIKARMLEEKQALVVEKEKEIEELNGKIETQKHIMQTNRKYVNSRPANMGAVLLFYVPLPAIIVLALLTFVFERMSSGKFLVSLIVLIPLFAIGFFLKLRKRLSVDAIRRAEAEKLELEKKQSSIKASKNSLTVEIGEIKYMEADLAVKKYST